MALSLPWQYYFCFVLPQARKRALQRSKVHDGVRGAVPQGPFFELRGVPQIPRLWRLG